MRLHDFFEWDDAKAEANFRKHGITFDTAALVLADENGDLFHHEQHDNLHSHVEDRYITFASHPADRTLVFTIVWTERPDHDGVITTRVISARTATSQEKKNYVKYLRRKTGA